MDALGRLWASFMPTAAGASPQPLAVNSVVLQAMEVDSAAAAPPLRDRLPELAAGDRDFLNVDLTAPLPANHPVKPFVHPLPSPLVLYSHRFRALFRAPP